MNNSKNKLKLKNSEGITLIALVVTIIVLIILAGVSINLLFGQYGVVTKAKDAKEQMEVAQVKEDIQLKLVDLQADKMLTGESVNATELEEVITEAGGEVVKNAEGIITGVKVGDTTIPIEEVTQGITIGDGSSSVKKDANGVEEGKSGYLGSTYNDPYIPVGFEHIGTADWNSGYQIKETATGNIFVWVPCVTDQSKVKAGDKVETFKKTLPTTTDTTDPYYKYNKNNLTITEDESSANAIETSVGTYGGFYIAAYEAGIEGTTENYALETKTATNGDVKPLSKAGCGVWNYITRADALTVAEAMVNTSDGVKSGLISGKCWDTTLQWMAHSSTNAENEPNAGYDIDSTGNGYYGQTDKNTTGQYPINNIYDMAGNVREWTTESCTLDGTSYLVNRGGGYNNSGSGNPAAYRGYYGGNACDWYCAFRVVLYK